LRAELVSQLEAEAKLSGQETKILEKQIAKLDRQRYLWAEKVMSGSVPDDIGRVKQEWLARQLSAARQTLAAHQVEIHDLAEVLGKALDLVASCHEGYVAASPRLRRQWNQAFFQRVELDHLEGGSALEMTPLFGSLRTAGCRAGSPSRGRRTKNPGLVFLGQGSNESRLVGYRQNLFHQGRDCAANRPVPALLSPSSHILAGAIKCKPAGHRYRATFSLHSCSSSDQSSVQRPALISARAIQLAGLVDDLVDLSSNRNDSQKVQTWDEDRMKRTEIRRP
jgi:hypothetical protein